MVVVSDRMALEFIINIMGFAENTLKQPRAAACLYYGDNSKQ